MFDTWGNRDDHWGSHQPSILGSFLHHAILMRSFEFSCIWRESKGLWKCILWNNLCLRQLSRSLHHVLQLLRNSRIYSDECNLQSCTYSADHRVQGKALETASRSDLRYRTQFSVGRGKFTAHFVHFVLLILMFKAVTNGSATVSMINLATWQNRDSRRMESLNLRPGLRYTGTVGNSGCLAVMLGGNCW